MPPARSLSVLVVDDHPDAADSLGGLVELYGHRAYVARTGGEAVHMAHATRPDVVLLDLGLPDSDGYAVAEKLRQVLAIPPLLAIVTGFRDTEARSKAAGIEHHFTKPVDPHAIKELLRSHAQKLERGEASSIPRTLSTMLTPPE